MGSLFLKKESFGENIKANHVRYLVNVTIESAKDFDQCSNVYVHYLVDAAGMSSSIFAASRKFVADIQFLLLDYVLAEAKDLHGVTHQSRARNDSKNHFGHRFSLDVSKSWHCHGQSSPTPPLLLLEVYDVNMWNRQKSVGYGFTHVPLSPGSYSVAVPTWRPHVTTSSLQLQDYFLGLAPQVQNIQYAGIPDHASPFFSPFFSKPLKSSNWKYKSGTG